MQVQEIGQDKANDLCSIWFVDEEWDIRKPIAENLNIFFEHGLALSSAYAIKFDVPQVLYYKDGRYKWE